MNGPADTGWWAGAGLVLVARGLVGVDSAWRWSVSGYRHTSGRPLLWSSPTTNAFDTLATAGLIRVGQGRASLTGAGITELTRILSPVQLAALSHTRQSPRAS